MLTHTNGLPDYTAWAKETIQREGAILDNEILLRFLRESGAAPEFAPGDRYSYGNTDYCLLAELIKQLSGVSFEEFLQTEIFEPAGMSVTRVGRPTTEEGAYGNLACGLVLDNGNYMLPENAAFDYMVPLFDQLRGCGNVYSNVDDLFAWDRALRQENVLTKEEQREMATPVMLNDGTIASDDGNGYGFGWSIEDDPVLGSIVGHDGNWDGYMGWYERFLDADRLLIFLTSRVPADVRAYVGFLDGMKRRQGTKSRKLSAHWKSLQFRIPIALTGSAFAELTHQTIAASRFSRKGTNCLQLSAIRTALPLRQK